MDNELITTYKEQLVTTSKEVAETFDKRHDHILRDIDALKKDVPNFGEMFFESTAEDSYGRPQRMFYMNRDGFSLLAMGFTGANAMMWKVKYIEAFNQMEKALNSPEQIMARALKVAQYTIDSLHFQIEEMQPKADYFDALVDRHLNINIQTTAKELGIKMKDFVKWLLDNHYVFRQSGTKKLVPYSQYSESGKGYFVIKEYKAPNSEHAGIQTLITPKGRETFRLLLKGVEE